jgi:hypothetical protein
LSQLKKAVVKTLQWSPDTVSRKSSLTAEGRWMEERGKKNPSPTLIRPYLLEETLA